MLDILLTPNGDLDITDHGDIRLTESIRQAIRIRLLWFSGEWRFAPGLGVPYLEEIFIKGPNIGRIRRIVRKQVMEVREVQDVRNISINIDAGTRLARIAFDVALEEGTYREEVDMPWGAYTD